MKTDPDAVVLAELVAELDLDGLGKHLTDDVRLRSLLPSGLVEDHGREAALARIERWFGDKDRPGLEDAAGELVGDRLLVHYRLRFQLAEGPHSLTQTWVASVGEDGRIFRIDLLCSGYRVVE